MATGANTMDSGFQRLDSGSHVSGPRTVQTLQNPNLFALVFLVLHWRRGGLITIVMNELLERTGEKNV